MLKANRTEYPQVQPQRSQNSLMQVKAVETIDTQLYGPVERPAARTMGGTARQIPEYFSQSGIVAKSQEGNVAQENGTSQDINSLAQKHNITTRGDLFFCNACFVYLRYDELTKHIDCVDHSHETNMFTNPVPRMPSLPSLYSTYPALPDANYIAVYVPAEQAIEAEGGRRPIFTQYVSLGSQKFPTFNAPTDSKEGPLERSPTIRRLL
ncbi:unnamed protein product [Hydatigera taeniaeformis]|uniref:C2H2-type domain-containing protein n=1 Tax=Hydatigena taeniaeformis TaxID=6205 RepID=A0A0R3X867_HYDTA|nr:unnamed protein product [Hydatigera taeniaeformis]